MKETYNKIFKLIILVAALLGVILHTVQSETPLQSFTYFTLQSNLLVVIVYLMMLLREFKSRLFQIIYNQTVIAIVLTGIVFNLLLRPTLGSIDYEVDSLSDILIHSLVPGLVLIDRFVFGKVGTIKKYDPIIYLSFPLFYWLFSMFYIVLGGNFNGDDYISNYPYFFLNFPEYGVGYFVLVIVFIVLLGYFVFGVDRFKLKMINSRL